MKRSSLNQLLAPVLESPPVVQIENEVEVLRELPVETLYLALKEADPETALWFYQNASPEQVQGIVDLDVWEGSEFMPARWDEHFKTISTLSPPKIGEYMKRLDPEIIVRGLLEIVDVLDYNPQDPPELQDDNFLLTLDNKFLLVLKRDDPDMKEALFQWLNKFSAADLELQRRHLESCKWEVPSDLEEFEYQMKKGRLEELGFVDYHEAIALYARGSAAALKKELLDNPLGEDTKFPPDLAPREDDLEVENPTLLPKPISRSVWGGGFIRDSLAKVADPRRRQILLMELLRVVNGTLAADKLLHEDLESIEKASARTRSYIELGLLYLSEGSPERGAQQLVRQPLAEVFRLGWLTVQDLGKAAADIKANFGTTLFAGLDARLLLALGEARHPELDVELMKDLELGEFPTFDSVLKVGARLAELMAIARFAFTDLEGSLKLRERPGSEGESLYARLLALLFRQSFGGQPSSAPITAAEWNEGSTKVDWAVLEKGISLLTERLPERARPLFARRLRAGYDELKKYIDSNAKSSTEAGRGKIPDPRFFKALIFAKT